MKVDRVVLTGATGFIGSAVLRELCRLREERRGAFVVRAVGRRPPAGPTGVGPLAGAGHTGVDEWADADLADPRTLAGVCDGADVLLHLAALVAADEEACVAVNARGTEALMAEAVRAGVGRSVHLSTAAVYGLGPFRGIAVDEVVPAPVSPASRTRLAGEAHALAAGASVLRPGLVLGAGDRWAVPALAELLGAVPALWDGGRARTSLTAVEDLARLITRTGLTGALPGGRIWYAGHPEPVTLAALVAALAREGIVAAPERTLPLADCLEELRASATRLSPRQFSLLAEDFWFDSREVWRVADCPAGPGPLDRLAASAQWYRELFKGRADR
ncbi:NAD-dependent epimerase/dehydratase family protein [Streptomyces sp. NPDC014656]|uniref:NAD-dependent epimerase/dehydratase family protein n=1 Tax=Streptomyces sp. NPDC014656 TaxID=3364878 RepID=UPI0036F7722F